MDSPSSPSLTHSHSRTQPQALTSVTPTITRSHYWPQALSLPVSRSSHVCFSLSLSSLSSDLSSPNVTQPRFATSAKISVLLLLLLLLLLFFRFITWCLKGVLLCIFICGIYFVDFWTWCNGPGFGFGGLILYIFELVANLVVRKNFLFLCIWVMYIGFMYEFVIFMYYFLWFLFLSLWFLYLGLCFERKNEKSKSKLL